MRAKGRGFGQNYKEKEAKRWLKTYFLTKYLILFNKNLKQLSIFN